MKTIILTTNSNSPFINYMTIIDETEKAYKLENEYKPIKRAFNPYAVLTSLSNEVLLCTLAAMDLSKGKILNEIDKQRLILAYSRIKEAYELCH